MGIIPGPLIAGPEPVGKRYGLLSAASGPIDMETHAKGGGYRYVPVTCGEAHTYAIDCSGGFVVHDEKQGDPDNAETDAGPFAVYASIECGALGYTDPEFVAKVERRLLNGEQGAVEYGIWSGLDADGNPLGIRNFVDEGQAVAVHDPTNIASVVSALEDWAYRVQGYGNVAYIHAPASVAAYAADRFLVLQDSNQAGSIRRTPFGSIWVFGGGYPGTGPDGAAPPAGGAYLYITGQTTVWRSSDIFTYPVAQTMDRENNQHFLLSEREYAVGFDCFAGRALYTPEEGP